MRGGLGETKTENVGNEGGPRARMCPNSFSKGGGTHVAKAMTDADHMGTTATKLCSNTAGHPKPFAATCLPANPLACQRLQQHCPCAMCWFSTLPNGLGSPLCTASPLDCWLAYIAALLVCPVPVAMAPLSSPTETKF
jgi:hypothetical protein